MLSQTVGYAIIALGYLAETGEGPILVKDIADATGVPAAYLSKIVNTLAKKGLVNTQRGIKGGVTLSRDATDITLYHLCEAMDDPLLQGKCMLATANCSDERACPAHKFWTVHREQQIEFLKTTTLKNVAEFEGKQKRWRQLPKKTKA